MPASPFSAADAAANLTSLLSGFTAERRLYDLEGEGEGELSALLVESWSLREALNTPWELQLNALSPRFDLDVQAMLLQKLTLITTLADGSKIRRSGVITDASVADSDGGLTPYAIKVRPWLSLLRYGRRSQLWANKSTVSIVESIFARYAPHAAWTWSPDTAAHLAASPFSNDQGQRSTTTQYRETDLAFVQRLLTEEGLVYRFEADEEAAYGHRLVILADTPSATSCPADPTSAAALGGTGIRFHRASSIETQDAIQAFGGQRRLQSSTTTVLAWDYKAKRAVATSVPTAAAFGGQNAPRLESYDPTSPYTYPSSAQAERAGVLNQQALEARHKTWLGRGTVRSFSSGTTFILTQSNLDALDLSLGTDPDGDGTQNKTFLLLSLTHAGINNLPKDVLTALSAARGPSRRPSGTELLAPWVDAELKQQTQAIGYANRFDAIRACIPWRPVAVDETGLRLNPKPTARGLQTATVVGPSGETQASGSDEIHTDALGRIRIQFHFQNQNAGYGSSGAGPDTSNASTWVRVLQRYAGAGMGLQFIPRIGQEVLVDFFEGDLDRPYVIAALYNGKGEAGTPATPGGQSSASDNSTSAFTRSGDHTPGAQGNLAGGNSPAWHGAAGAELSAGGQANAGALSGVKTKEFGGAGYNQLVFDDSDQQLRTQLATTQHATQLNLGHLIHQADNHRGSFRGLGFELRTDAYGSFRAKNGLLISSYGIQASEPAGDNTAGIALANQLKTLAQAFSSAARTHETVQLAGILGATKANQSSLSEKEAPYQALHTALKGMVSEATNDEAQLDAANKNTSTDHKVPHLTDPIVAISAKAGLAVVAGQDVQLAAGEGITLAAGRDSHWATGGASRVHTGQAIGILGGAIQPGAQAAGTGISLIAGEDDIDVQAQNDRMQVAAKNDLAIQSKSTKIDWAAAKKIVFRTAGGACLTIEGGNITVECPGTITAMAYTKSFVGPDNSPTQLPELPHHTMQFDEKFQLVDANDDPLKNMRIELTRPDGSKMDVISDGDGNIPIQQGFSPQALKFRVVGRVRSGGGA